MGKRPGRGPDRTDDERPHLWGNKLLPPLRLMEKLNDFTSCAITFFLFTTVYIICKDFVQLLHLQKTQFFLNKKNNCRRQPSFPVFTSHGLPLLARSVHKQTTRSPQPAKRRTRFTTGCPNVFLFFQGTLCHEFNRRLYRPAPGFLMSTVFLDSQH